MNLVMTGLINFASPEPKERTGLTQDGVVQGLLKEAEFTGDGSSPAARVSAWAHLGRHLGMFKDKIAVGGKLTVEVVRFGDPALPQ